jgi:hypothetical protein
MVLAVSGNRLTNLNLSGLASQVGSANLTPLGGNRFNLHFNKQSGALLQGNLTLGQLGFAAISNVHSDLIELHGESLNGVRSDTGLDVDGDAGVGRVFVVGLEPILDGRRGSGQLALTLYAFPGQYALERNSEVGGTTPWLFDSFIDAATIRTDLPLRPMAQAHEFFRAYAAPGLGVPLSIRLEDGQVVVEWSQDCADCILEASPTLGSGAVWTPTAQQPQIIDGLYRVLLPTSAAPQFLRLAIPSP